MDEIITGENYNLGIDNTGSTYLFEAARWGKFIAIVGFIFIALMVLFGIFGGALETQILNQNSKQFDYDLPDGYAAAGATVFTVMMIIFAIIAFFPFLYLYNFSSRVKTAIKNNNQSYLNASFKNLKSYFKFYGIILIIAIAFYAIVAIFATIFGLSFTK